MGKKPSFAEGTSRYMHGRLQQKGRHYFRKKADDRNGEMVRVGKTVRATGRGPDFYFQPPAAQGAE